MIYPNSKAQYDPYNVEVLGTGDIILFLFSVRRDPSWTPYKADYLIVWWINTYAKLRHLTSITHRCQLQVTLSQIMKVEQILRRDEEGKQIVSAPLGASERWRGFARI